MQSIVSGKELNPASAHSMTSTTSVKKQSRVPVGRPKERSVRESVAENGGLSDPKMALCNAQIGLDRSERFV
jgi:hypothetical protein